jgi:hypothetical protein
MATYSSNSSVANDVKVILNTGLNTGASLGLYALQTLETNSASQTAFVQVWSIEVPSWSDDMALQIYDGSTAVDLMYFPDNATASTVVYKRGENTDQGRILMADISLPIGCTLRWKAKRASSNPATGGVIMATGQKYINTP